MKRLLKYRFIILAVLMLLCGFILGKHIRLAAEEDKMFINEQQTQVESQQIEKTNKKTDLKKIYRKPALLFFHSRDCSSCEKFKPNWQYLKKKYNKQFEFIEIDVDDPRMLKLNFEFMINIIPAVYIEDAHFRNRVYVNPVMYHIMPRFEDELDRYLEMREILKRGDNL